MASIFDSKFCIPLDFEILESGLPLYQYGLGSQLTYELTFADHSDVIKSAEANPVTSYTFSNIFVASATNLFCDFKDHFSGKIRDDPSGHFTFSGKTWDDPL